MDSGELGAAAFSLGVAHPTGFPLYLLLGKASTLWPVGEIAFRLDLLSALCGALSCVLAARLVRALAPSPGDLGALSAAALVACGATFWSQATVAEVYVPSAAALLALLVLARRLLAGGSPRVLLALALAAGLATGLHASVRLAVLALAGMLLVTPRTRALLARRAGPAAAAFLLGCAVQLYLPLASAREPPLDWGNPETLGALWDHLRAARITRAFADQIGVVEWTRWSHHLGLYLERLAEVVSWPGLALLPAGAVLWWRHSRPLATVLGVLVIADLLFGTLINPMGLEDRQVGVPAQVLCALLVATVLAEAARRGRAALEQGRLRAGRALLAGAASAALALVVAAALAAPDQKMRQGDHAPGEVVDAVLKEIPPRAALFCHSDDLCAGTLFARIAEGARPDLTVLVRQHVWVRSYLARAGGDLVRPALLSGDREQRIARQGETLRRLTAAARALGRVVAWEPGDDDSVAGVALAPAGLLSSDQPRAWRWHADLSALLGANPRLGAATREHAGRLWDRRGRELLAAGDPRGARAALARALELAPTLAQAWNNLAVLLARRDDLRGAIRAAREATRHAPLHAGYWSNLGLYLLKTGADADAASAYRRSRRLAPRDPRPVVGLGILAARSRRYQQARDLLRLGLRMGARGDTRADALANLRRLRSLKRPR